MIYQVLFIFYFLVSFQLLPLGFATAGGPGFMADALLDAINSAIYPIMHFKRSFVDQFLTEK